MQNSLPPVLDASQSNASGPPYNLISYHFKKGIPDFIQSRLNQLVNTPKTFNISGLLKNFFTPYKRLEVSGKNEKFGAKTFADKLTFNLTSIFVGVGVRLTLIFTWLLATILLAILDLVVIPIYAVIPLFSYSKYSKEISETFFLKDIETGTLFLKKFTKTEIFSWLYLFLGENFGKIFDTLSAPKNAGITNSQKPTEMVAALYRNWPPLKTFLEQNNIKEKEFLILINYLSSHLLSPQTRASSAIGQTLSYGYTNNLDKYAGEITSINLPSEEKKQKILELERVLVRPQNNNILLVGEPGIGRHNTISELSATISRNQLPTLSGHRVLLLDTVTLAAVGNNLVDTKNAFEQVFKEGKNAGNIILVIDHIDKVASSQDGRLDLTDVLTTVLNDNSMPIIGITTPDDFNQYIRPNPTFLSLFEKISLDEPSVEETESILIGKAMEFWGKEKVRTDFAALIEIAKKSDRLVTDSKQPEKSIILLNDAIAQAKAQGTNTVDLTLVDSIIGAKTKTPVGAITKTESTKLKDLEKILHQRIIGQDEAIDGIAKAMRRSRAEIESTKRPIGSFLFLGPTGVGKTETAKALAESYFGDEERMVRFDMTEYQNEDGITRLIGNPQTKSQGQLATKIRENPYTLLLVDEFEKANKEIHNLFLQILDEGFLTDAFGKKVSFDNVIIIATSNAGAEFIREQVSKQGETLSESQGLSLSESLVDYILKQGLFSPELINRFDGTVVYKPLTQEQVVSVTQLMLNSVAKGLKESKNISLEITPALAAKVAQMGFNAEFGARPIRRLIQDKIEDGIAKLIIDGSAKSGSRIDGKTLLSFL